MDDTRKALFRLNGPDALQEEYTVGTQGFKIGRLSDNDLTLNHREISRQHIRIIWREDKYFVEDLGSSNGSFLGDERLKPREPVELREGDTIRFGPYTLQLVNWIDPEPEIAAELFNEGYDTELESLRTNGHIAYLPGIPRDRSTWMQYLPEIYDEHEFMGRYLLIFESLMSPIMWTIDNFDLFLSPDIAPSAWLEWMASWFDLLLLPELPIEYQRNIMNQIGWLFMRRGTPAGLQRLLELYFGVSPEIIEDELWHFVVRLPLSQSQIDLGREIADRLIESQKPAFVSYTLEVT